MYYLFGITEEEVRVGEEPYYDTTRGIYEKIRIEQLVAIFSTEEKAQEYAYSCFYTDEFNYERKLNKLLSGFIDYEIREIPTDPE